MSSLDTPLSWLESAALAVDRSPSLKELTPDSNEYFFFNVIHLQQEKKLAEASQWIERYRQRFAYSQEFKTAETRQKLLLYDDPKTSAAAKAEILQWIVESLRLTFAHAKDASRNEVVESHFPTSVPADDLADETLLKKAFNQEGVRGITNHPLALEWLANSGKVKLDENQLEQLLEKITEPWLDNLPAHISEHLKKRSFGSIWTHSRLTLAQLDALVKSDSSLANNENFVKQRLDRLLPSDNADDEPQTLTTEAQSARLSAVCNYALSLPAAFNSIKIAVLYHRLNTERAGGILDQDKFWQYIQIPKSVHYANQTWLANERKHSENVAYLGNFSTGTIPAVHDDEPLVREFLMAFFKNPSVKSVDKFAPYISQDFLKQVFAQAKLLYSDRASDEDVGKWIAMLENPSFAASLKERVDVEFSMTNKRVHPVADAVSLDVVVKNVKTLVVKIFEINTRAYYRAERQAVPDDINLDGLTAHTEFEVPCAASSSFVRTLKSIPLPSLTNRRGVFVVELLGNGSTARAVIRKGHLRFFDRKTLAGHIFRVYDEKGAQVPAASIWLSGQNYTADANGEIVVPYNPSSSSHQTIVISAGDFSDLGSFVHESENYRLRAGFYVDRESLTRTRRADVVIRPDFTLNGLPTSFKLLENVALTITTTDEGQVESAQTVNGSELVLDSSQETVFTFTLPENVRKVSFELRASVKRAVDGSTQQLSDSQSFDVNSIEDTNQIDELHLRWAGNGYSVYLLGKAGEARANVALQLTFQHSFVNSSHEISCQTDQSGKVFLGHLPNVVGVTARVVSSNWTRDWALTNSRRVVYNTQLVARKGQTLVLPYAGQQQKVTTKYFCILHKSASGQNLSECTSALSISNGMLVVAPLAPGSYTLFHKELNLSFQILVVDGPLINGKYVMTPTRFLELSQPVTDKPWSPLHVLNASVVEEKGSKDSNLVVHLSNASQDARVHVIATHFFPEWGLFDKLAQHSTAALLQSAASSTAESTYLSQKALSMEQRYILDRKGAKKYVGNMLERPSLLLNPRVHDTTSFDDAAAIASRDAEEERRLGGGGMMRREMAKARAAAPISSSEAYYSRAARFRGSSASRNLEFLAGPASTRWNLRASANGTVSIPMSQLQLAKKKGAADQAVPSHTTIVIVATDAAGTALYRLGLGQLPPAVSAPIIASDNTVAFADGGAYADTRLLQSLDGSKHLLEQHIVSLLLPGQAPLLINDVKSATVVAYETLQDAYALYSTVFGTHSDGPLLKKFDFLPRWQSLSDSDKKAKYSEFSCNELNYFLFKKDPQFFQAVVHNFVAQKPKFSRTFLDNWFLFPAGDSIFATYAAPRQYKRLNFFEKVLLAEKLGPNGLKNIGRLAADLDEAHPKDREAFVKRFKTAVQTKYMASPPPPEPENDAYFDESKESLAGADEDCDDEELECERACFDDVGGASESCAPPMAMMAMASFSAPAPPPAPGAKGLAKKDARMLADFDSPRREFDGLMEKRSAVRQMFREPESTKEYEENGYYLFGCNADTSSLVSFTPFWGDFAAHVAAGQKSPFLSQHFGDVGRTFSSYVLALAVLDLPFKPVAPTVTEDGFNMQYQANAPCILFNKQVRDGDIVPSSVAVSQNYYDPQDAFTETKEDGRIDKYIENEFLMNKEYCCRVVLTNVSSNLQKVEVLMQIPQGAMPVGHDNTTEGRGFRTRTVFIEIPAYSTKMLEYSFYFPALGQYKHYPVHASRNGRIIGFGQPRVLKVVTKSTAQPDLTSWKHVSQNGTNEQVLHFLEQQNVHKVTSELAKMAWRFKKQDADTKAFFQHALERLRARHVFDTVLWSYSLYHQDAAAVKEYLPVTPLADRVGPYFASGLLSVDAYTSGKYNHYEYAPLINQRAHALQARTSGNMKQLVILNNQLEKQYREFLALMMYRFSGRNEIDRAHLMVAIYYLLLQDRIDSARELFVVLSARKHDPAAVVQEGVQLQYDYLRAYMDFSSASLDKGPLLARDIAASYKQYPVNKKRKLFEEIEKQAEEIFGSIQAAEKEQPAAAEHKPEVPEPSARDREMAALASSEPSLDFAIEDKQLVIHYQNVKSVVLNVFYMDIELLFSTNAFIDGHSGNEKFTYVAPNRSLTIDNLRGASQAVAGTYTAPIPDFLNNRNAYVEVVAPGTGVSRSVPFYSHSLNLQLTENYGQLKVANRATGAAIPQAYVKVFSRSQSGEVEFFKDGYTDMRGRFDYASVSSKKLESIAKFSILVLTESHGAVVRQASPPAR